MGFGKTLDMIEFNRLQRWRARTDRAPVVRDRSLSGKKRIKARKAENKVLVEREAVAELEVQEMNFVE